MGTTTRCDVAVVGGGIIGLAIAWRARARGLSVALVERDELGAGTSRMAAGMIAPSAEADFGEAARRLLALGLRSAQLWPGFAAELEEAGGVDVPLLATGTLVVARDDDEARELERQLQLRRSLGLEVERLRASDAREREPALASAVRLGLALPDDRAVDPRRALEALARACRNLGVDVRERVGAASLVVDRDGSRAVGVDVGDGERVAADVVVLATGTDSAAIGGLPAEARVPVRPVKGQILRLRDPEGAGLLRGIVRFHGGYLVPRGDGRYVLGATMEERGFELDTTVAGVYELLRDAREVVPGVLELEIEELGCGLRPATPDNLPAIGPTAVGGLLWATGHYRSGVLLAPITAELVTDMLAGERAPLAGPELDALAPERFAVQAPVAAAVPL